MNQATIHISKSLPRIAQAIDESIEEISGEKLGFMLVVFTEGRGSYVSNCDRKEIVRELRVLLDHWEKGMPDIPAHAVSH